MKVELLVLVDELDGVELLTVVLVVLSAGCSSPLEPQPASPAASAAAATELMIAFMPHPVNNGLKFTAECAARHLTRQSSIQF